MAAIAHMIISGDRYIKEILVLGDGDKMCTPCGGCRQKIREFSDPYTMIHVANSFGILKSFTLEELLPYSFGPESIVCTK
jgi:cytidine deaminase